MFKLLANKYVLGAAGLLLALAAIWGYGRYQYRQGVADTQIAAKLAAAKQYKADVARINDSVGVLQARIEELQHAKPKIVTEYRDRVVKAPMPADCRPDDIRLRIFEDARKQSNASR